MVELVRTNDVVHLSFLEALLTDAGIEHVVLDRNLSSVEGSISAFARRVMVADADAERARAVLEEAGIELRRTP